MADEKLNLSEHVTALFEGVEGVTDDQKTKMETVLEAALSSLVADKEKSIQESFDAKVEELVESHSAELETTVNKYLDYVVTEWMEENKLAVENGLQLEMAQSFFSGMKQVFVEHNVTVPEGKENLVASYESKITELEGKVNESTATVIEQGSVIEGFAKAKVVAEASIGLTDTQKEKFDSLIEGVEFGDAEVFAAKVGTLRESYFKSGDDKTIVVKTPVTSLNENADPIVARENRLLNPYG